MYYHPHFTVEKKTDETECSKYIKVKIINKLAKTCTSRALLRNTYIINSFSNTYCREQNNLLSCPPSSCSAIHWFLFHEKRKVIRISSSFHFYIHTSTGLHAHKLDFHSCYCQWFTVFSICTLYTIPCRFYPFFNITMYFSSTLSFLSAIYRHGNIFSLSFFKSNTIFGTFLFSY